MPNLPAIVVDVHSHVFNAEDLPIDGFIKTLAPAPRLLTGLFSWPLDKISQFVARGTKEKQDLLTLLGRVGGLEGLASIPTDEVEVASDDELLRRLEADWRRLGLDVRPAPAGALEAGPAAPPSDAELARALASAPPAEVHELQAWLEEWDPDLLAGANLEGGGGILRYLGGLKDAIGRYAWSAGLMARRRYQVAAELAQTYPDVSLFVSALVDFGHTSRDTPSTPVREQIAIHSLVAKLSIAGGLPGAPDTRVAPLVGFDPYREVSETLLDDWDPARGAPNPYVPYGYRSSSDNRDVYHRGIRFDPARGRPLRTSNAPWHQSILDLAEARGGIDIVRYAVERGGFVGVKLYPPAGFFPLGNALRFPGAKGERLDAALRALYGFCEVMEVPLLAHASHSNGFEPGYNEFAGPAGWELVFSEYPKLRVCLAHFGHLYGVSKDGTDPSSDGWPQRFVGLIDRYPHVYADVGNSELPVSKEYRLRFIAMLGVLLGGDRPDEAQAKRRRRLMYGSDFWMNTLSPRHEGYFEGFREAMKDARFDTGTREAFLGRNALRFLGFTGADDEPDFANLNRKRLVAFHGSMTTPPWLPREP